VAVVILTFGGYHLSRWFQLPKSFSWAFATLVGIMAIIFFFLVLTDQVKKEEKEIEKISEEYPGAIA